MTEKLHQPEKFRWSDEDVDWDDEEVDLTKEAADLKRHDQLKHYWTATPEGLAKWRDHPHPWTALYRHLKKHITPDTYAKVVTSAWYRDVFGHMPNEGKGNKESEEGNMQ